MTNRKSTKRALLGSVMAMVLCLAMLVGATFAWFTDTASTGVNKIQAGNLDIEIKLDKSGQLRLNLFSHSADDYTTYLDNTQRNGVGIAYQREFNTLKEFFRNLFTGRKKREQRAAAYDNGPRELKRISIFKDGDQGESKKK